MRFLTILFCLLQCCAYANELLVKDLDNDKIKDTVRYKQSTGNIICRLSTLRFVPIQSKAMDAGDNAGVESTKSGFEFYVNWMRAGYKNQFRYDVKTKKVQLIGMSRYEFGNAVNDGSGESSVNLLTNDYIGNWNYYDVEKDTLVSIPSIKQKMAFGKIYLENFSDETYYGFAEKCAALFEQGKSLAILDSQLSLLAAYSEDTEIIDFDELQLQAQDNLMTYLKQKRLYDKDSIQNLYIVASADSNVRLHTYAYQSGGTRGEVHNPVIQWKKSDGTFGVYALPYEMDFYSIDKLTSKSHNLYLLTGAEKGSSRLFVAMCLVIQIKNDYLILDYPAFFNGSSDLVYFDDLATGDGSCIACIDYEAKTQTIHIKDLGDEDIIGSWEKNAAEIVPKVGKVKSCTFQFDGNKFVRK